MEIRQYTNCYLQKDGKILMLYRNKKQNDVNKGKWIGVGGKFEDYESIYDCAKREIQEETGYIVNSLKLIAVNTVIYDDLVEYIYFLKTDDFHGEMISDCREGSLEWVDNSEVLDKKIWDTHEEILKRIIDNNDDILMIKIDARNNKIIKVKEIW